MVFLCPEKPEKNLPSSLIEYQLISNCRSGFIVLLTGHDSQQLLMSVTPTWYNYRLTGQHLVLPAFRLLSPSRILKILTDGLCLSIIIILSHTINHLLNQRLLMLYQLCSVSTTYNNRVSSQLGRNLSTGIGRSFLIA